MDKPIQVGDLVMQVRPCVYCGDANGLGVIFRVIEMYESGEPLDCCGNTNREICAVATIGENAYPLAILKRIPPLDELQTFRQTDETTV